MAKGKRPFGYTIPFMDGIGFVPPTIYTPRIAINWCWRVGRPLTDFSSITDNILRSWKDGVAPKKKRKKKRRNLLDTVNASVRSIESCVDWVWKWTSEEINHIVPHSFFFWRMRRNLDIESNYSLTYSEFRSMEVISKWQEHGKVNL